MRRPLHALHCRRGRGLTLLDMAVALAILSVLAAVLVPALSHKTRNRQAEAAIEEVQLIVDAARWYWHSKNYWPGQIDSTTCGNADWWESNAQDVIDRKVRQDLDQAGHLPGFTFMNPWGEPYQLDFVGTPHADEMGDVYNCWMRISTNIPDGQLDAVRPFFPNLQCKIADATNNGCWRNLDPPAGFDRCCIHIPRPGREVNLWYSIMDMDTIIPLLIPCSPWPSAPGFAPDSGLACPTKAEPPPP